tara:strand:+ start:5965 stop:6660 length:696 start_codon:yes stop_codon:yes gene_type:complete
MKFFHALILVPVLAGCGALGTAQSVVSNPFGNSTATPVTTTPGPAASGWDYGATAPGSTLYGRDGSPVGVAPARNASNGVTVVSDDPLGHGLEGQRGSRLVLLDLYQQAVDERDELLLEVEGQHEMLSAADSRIQGLEAKVAMMQAQMDATTLERNTLQGQTHELAERLVTAQMRRLQAEKRYLETAIQVRTGPSGKATETPALDGATNPTSMRTPTGGAAPTPNGNGGQR